MLNPSPNNKRKVLWSGIGAFLLVLFMYNEWIKERIGASPFKDSGSVPSSTITESKPESLTQNIPASTSSKVTVQEANVDRTRGLAPPERNEKEIIYEFPSNEKILIQ